jgi:hypothetical protein
MSPQLALFELEVGSSLTSYVINMSTLFAEQDFICEDERHRVKPTVA